MPIEHASVRVMHKPWGVSGLKPWSDVDGARDAVGELWFERADKNAPVPELLLKLLFTSGPLSIQVHPDDTFAHAMCSSPSLGMADQSGDGYLGRAQIVGDPREAVTEDVRCHIGQRRVPQNSGESLKDVLPMVREVAERVVSMRWEDVGVDIVVAPSL